MQQEDNRESALFRQACQLSAGPEREAFLEKACGTDAALHRRLKALLQAHEKPNKALDGVTEHAPGATIRISFPEEEGPGTLIGRYKLLQKIGEGGMGIVYMAEQEEPVRRRVALKIIKLGMDTRQVIARFEAERQALALMDHPNIARVLDGGATDTGRPYFVMELVHGVPITEFCDRNRLSAQERLKLFIPVCQAIQSAHQKGIIHRDIKPSNVLVTLHHGEPMPKVIDFGVAKATDQKLTEKTLFTHFGTMIGTPAYMSPEQAEMSSLDVDTRADLYSLGVLLYELLTGTTPFPEKRLRSLGYAAMQKVILEEEPERPSKRLSTMDQEQKTTMVKGRGADVEALGNLLKGDLDWIVMKCLEKDRRRRYESASGLVADIERHLGNEPVLARPPSAAYRLNKAIRRNKGKFVTAAAVAASLIVGTVISTWEAVVATKAKNEAERAQKAEWQARQKAVESQKETEKIAEIFREKNYAADMHMACNSLDSFSRGKARAIIEQHRPQAITNSSNGINLNRDLRGWEWRYLWEQMRPQELSTILKQDSGASGLAFSTGDNPLLAFTAGDQLKIWDFNKKEALKVLALPAYCDGIAFSPNAKWLACASRDAGMIVWDTATWRLRQQGLYPNDWIIEVAFSPDSRFLAATSQVAVKLCDTSTFEELASLPAFYDFNNGVIACGIAFSPDGRTLAYGASNSLVKLWDTVSKSPAIQLPTHSVSVNTLCFSPDGRKLVSGTQGHDSFLRVYDLTSPGTYKDLIDNTKHTIASRTRFSPDGRRLAVVIGNEIRIFNTETWEEIRKDQADFFVLNLDFSPDGRYLVSSSSDGAIQIWKGEPTTPEPDQKAIPPEAKWSALSPGGETLLTIYTNCTFTIWHTATLQEGPPQPFPGDMDKLCNFDFIPFGAAVAPDGKRIAYMRKDGALAVWNVVRHQEVAAISTKTGEPRPMRFSHDGTKVAFSDDVGGEADVWDLGAKTNSLSVRMSGSILSFDFSRDGTQLAVGSTDADSYGEIWSLTQHRRMAKLTTKRGGRYCSTTQIALSHNGRFAATAGYGGIAKLWNLQNQPSSDIELINDNITGIMSFAFSPDDSQLIASAFNTQGGAIKVVGVQSGEEVASIQASSGFLSFLPDGNTLILHGDDSRLRRFRAAPFSETDAVDANAPGNGK